MGKNKKNILYQPGFYGLLILLLLGVIILMHCKYTCGK